MLICQTTFKISKFEKWPHPVRAKTKMDFHVSLGLHDESYANLKELVNLYFLQARPNLVQPVPGRLAATPACHRVRGRVQSPPSSPAAPPQPPPPPASTPPTSRPSPPERAGPQHHHPQLPLQVCNGGGTVKLYITGSFFTFFCNDLQLRVGKI